VAALDQGEPEPQPERLRPPGLVLMLAEARAVLEFNTSLLLSPLLLRAPRGDGHPVLALPGFLASDISMAPLRGYLKQLGYDCYGWKIGRNLGGIASRRNALKKRLTDIYDSTGRKVSIVGWSLGGIYARDLALQLPDLVRSVITLASPFANDVRATNATRLYEALSGETVEANSELIQAIGGDLPVPVTSIWSRTDGIANWRTSLVKPSATAENIEVYLASHIGIGVNAAALWAIADRLAQPEGQFHPFDRSGPFAIAYGREEQAQSEPAS
jgi:pimeloyl-ACP methyl ester carboxylesterase